MRHLYAPGGPLAVYSEPVKRGRRTYVRVVVVNDTWSLSNNGSEDLSASLLNLARTLTAEALDRAVKGARVLGESTRVFRDLKAPYAPEYLVQVYKFPDKLREPR